MLTKLYQHLFKPKPPVSKPSAASELDDEVPTQIVTGQPAAKIPVIPNWQPGDVIMDRYRVEQVMAGSMGKVYICEHLGWHIRMAIKSPKPEVLADREGMRRILKEANSWIRMGMHPNIATCYYALSIERVPHLFIEYVNGGSLSEWIKTGRCRDLRTALSLAIQFCHGMEYTHAQGIIHRDIKPANILVTKNALLKITDFGILLSTRDHDETGGEPASIGPAPDQEATVGFRGTPGYASPEQLRNAHRVDQRTDIFSFGLCLWLMLCGRKPFTDNSLRQEVPEPEPTEAGHAFPPILAELLKKTVAYQPEERYASFAELRHDLNQAYIALFKVSCPYAELTTIDLRSTSLNNHAVSFFELGKVKKAAECLEKALEITDVLPEAMYNLILLKWRLGQMKPDRILRQIEAARKRLAGESIFDDLAEAVKRELLAGGGRDRRHQYPEFKLCAPLKTLEVFRDGQLSLSVQRSIMDHLENRRYEACHRVLQTAWANRNYGKDKVFNRVYEQLSGIGRKETVVGAQRLLTLRGGPPPVTSLAYVPGSRKVVAANKSGRVVIWDFATQKQTHVLGERRLPVLSLAASPKGGLVAIGTGDGMVTLWSAKSGESVSARHCHEGGVTALSFSGDGQWLASGGADGTITLYRLSTGRELNAAIPEGGAVRSLTLFAKGADLITGSDDGTIRFWEGGSEEYVRVLEAHAMPVNSMAASPDGKRFVTASADRLVKVWERLSGRCLKIIEAHEEAISSVLMLPDNRTIVSGCDDDIIKLWDSETGRQMLILDGRGNGIASLAPGPKSHTFLAGRRDGAVLFWMVIHELNFD